MTRVRIVPLTLRDATYIGANMREADRREVSCQCPAGTSGSDALAAIYQGTPDGWAWAALLDGNPECAFGFQPYSAAVFIGWALGTDKMTRVIPAVTRHCWAQEQRLLDMGVRRVEVRTIDGHDAAHAWLDRLGCRKECDLPDSGRGGEQFQLWAWRIGDGRPTKRSIYNAR